MDFVLHIKVYIALWLPEVVIKDSFVFFQIIVQVYRNKIAAHFFSCLYIVVDSKYIAIDNIFV